MGRVGGLSDCRQINIEGGAVPLPTVDIDISPVILNRSPNDGHTEAGTACVHRLA